MSEPKYEVVSNDRGVHHFAIGTTVRLVRRSNPPRDFTGDREKLPSLYEGVFGNQLITQWLHPDEVRRV